ncbi:glycoside hydrolase family 9 protein [Catenulispora yoronensis]|uniref:Glycoside hydrolase family 9 protein n=1 Tax=Catenulispora yoronensis TaxID=450799 RepID=A0ABN2U014_9ACTN
MRSRADHRILTGHLGYGAGRGGAVVVAVPDGVAPARVEVVTAAEAAEAIETGTTAETIATAAGRDLAIGPVQTVPGWTVGPFVRCELPPDLPAGRYAVRALAPDGTTAVSQPFAVEPDGVQRQTMSDVLAYFKAMRSSGEIDRKDRTAAFFGDDSGRTVDARGGWLDASGDTSKFLSHLTYTRTMSPQQTPLCAWAMLAARDALAEQHPALTRSLSTRLRDEALWGADFLVRFQDPAGYFYVGIFDALTKQLDERVINAPLPDCVRTDRYQAAYRHGGGLAIAALARASRADDDGDFPRAEYLRAARAGFAHLEKHNTDYLWDGAETVLDDYCALLAAVELVAAEDHTDSADAVVAADRRAANLIARYRRPADGGPGWFAADAEERPFFHAAEPGLPILALLRFAEVLPFARHAEAARELAVEALCDVVRRTDAVPNPFGYPRQRVQPLDGPAKDAFFFPHSNETGYWWQGENAGIASLSAAAAAVLRQAGDLLTDDRRARLAAFADDQLAWILGRNPFDACLLAGRGRGNVDYHSDFPNLPGGIVNGITSGYTDENDIAFLPADAPEGDGWRWAEQWIPHTGWFLLAVASAS